MINNMSKIFNPLKLVLIIFFISQLSLPLIHGFQKNAKKNEFYPGDALDIVFIDSLNAFRELLILGSRYV